jgi:hypothetical protein
MSFKVEVGPSVPFSGGSLNSPDGTAKVSISNTGTAVNGNAPVAKAGAIGAPNTQSAAYVQADVQSIVTAVNSIRTALTNFGITG